MRIDIIDSNQATQLCRTLIDDLPEYFGLAQNNANYIQGVQSRINFAAFIDEERVGLLSLEVPYPNNANVYWMGVYSKYHGKGIGKALIEAAKVYAKNQGMTSVTVETLAPFESDPNYLKTYHFYRSMGFNPMFNLKSKGDEWNMVYLSLNLTPIPQVPQIQLPASLQIRLFKEEDIEKIVDAFEAVGWDKPAITFELYLLEQEKSERKMWVAYWDNQVAGYITLKWHSGYAPFQVKDIPEIKDLNVLPAFRGRGIAKHLLDLAETEAAKQYPTIGLSVGLYKDYGSAQRLYVQRGYIPDGQGVTYEDKCIPPGETVRVDDSFGLWMTKRLR